MKTMYKRSTAVLLLLLARGYAQAPPPPPAAYSLTEVNSMFGPAVTVKVDRDGSWAVVEQTIPKEGAKPDHLLSYYNSQTHDQYTINLNDPQAGCNRSRNLGDWGDPFVASAEIMKPDPGQSVRNVGDETISGFAVRVLEADVQGAGKIKVWYEPKTGLVMRALLADKPLVDVQQFSLGKPPAARLALPAACKAAPGPPPTDAERFLTETGDPSGQFANAMMPPREQVAPSCTVLFGIYQAGTMQPVTSGFRLGIDTHVDVNHPAHYLSGPTFSGGGLHEVTAQLKNGVLRIDNAPAQFYIDILFGDNGGASALIYRQCVAPQTRLMLVMKNAAKAGEGADWIWVRSGKFAVGR